MTDRTVGVAGLGSMGKALAEALINAEYEVAVWDRHTDRVATTAMLGAAPSTQPNELADLSNVIFLALPHPEAVREVLFTPGTGLLESLQENTLILDMTTGDRALAEEVAEKVAALGNGSRYLDAPVSGKAPRLTVLLGATRGELGADEAVVNDIASDIIYTGEVGKGFETKLVHQHVKYATHLAVAEALTVAQQAGLDVTATMEAIEKSTGVAGGQKSAFEFFRNDARGIKSHAPTKTIAKDMRQAAALAESAGATSSTLAATHDFFTQASEQGYEARPYPETTERLIPGNQA